MPLKSPYPPIDIPVLDLWTFLFEREDKGFADDKALYIDLLTNRTQNFTTVRSTALAWSRFLQTTWRWSRGSVLLFFIPNSIDTGLLIWGLHHAGGVASTANPLYTAAELAFQLKDSGAQGMVTMAPFLPVALEAARAVGMPEDRVILMGDARDPTGKVRHVSELLEAKAGKEEGEAKKVPVQPKKDLAFLVYSSGTTGLPKGVGLTHYNLVSNILQMHSVEGRYIGLHTTVGGDRALAVLPFFHVYGLVCILHMALFTGVPAYVLPKFDLPLALRAIQDHRLTFFYVPPPIILALGKVPIVDQYDLSSLRVINSAAAPLTSELVDAVWTRLKIPVKQGYGLSETSPATHVQTMDEWARYIGSVGRLVPNVEARISDLETGKEVGVGKEHTGELWVRGPNVFGGYHNRPELNKDIFVEAEDGGGRWFKTGDIAYVDSKGNYYITDRLKELIKYKGFQVPPAELEGVLLGHPDIADACVIGIYDEAQATELPRAYVVLRGGGGSEEKAKEIAEWMATKVASHKKLRGGVVFVDEVPKTASGKILRRVLREQVKAEGEAQKPKL